MKNVDRVHKLLDSDRFGFVSGSKQLIESDIADVLSEYFYTNNRAKLELIPNGEKFNIKITLDGCTLRSFNIIHNE